MHAARPGWQPTKEVPMKTLIAAVLLFPLAAQAETLEKEVFRQTTDITVPLHPSSVRCSALGYGQPELKVDVPDLDWAAVFNHRQLGEGEPCMTAGVCDGTHTPARVLAGGAGDIPAHLLVVHTEIATIDRGRAVCVRELVEELTMELRGLTFAHRKSTPLLPWTAAECRKLYK